MFSNQHKSVILSLIILVVASSFAEADALNYRSYFYNIYDIVLFSYEDGTDIEVYRWGQLKYSGQLDKGQHARIQVQYPEPVIGVFEVRSSSKNISILTGDMIDVGLDIDTTGDSTASVFLVPEPCTLLLIGVGSLILRVC